jgi:8-oxo-dGTP pyrophosphatase MutT (NUDIX family)
MVAYELGPRVGRTAPLRVGVAAAILDGDRILLTRRSDNGVWCMPGGGVDPGESLAEACVREVREEIGVQARVTGLLGTYSSPDVVAAYPDWHRAQIVAAVFRVEIVSGTPGHSDEVTELGWFTAAEAAELPLIATQQRRIPDVFARDAPPFFD